MNMIFQSTTLSRFVWRKGSYIVLLAALLLSSCAPAASQPNSAPVPPTRTPYYFPVIRNSQPVTSTPTQPAGKNTKNPAANIPSSSKNPAGQQSDFLNFVKTKPSKQQVHDYLLKQNSQADKARLKTFKPGPNPVRNPRPATGPGNSGKSVSLATSAGQVFTVTTLEDKDEGYCGANCSLREAIYAANDATGPVIIKFSVSGTITLNSLPPYITNKAGVTIDGNGQKVIIQGYKPISSLNDFSRAVFRLSGLMDDSTTDCSPYFSGGDLSISGAIIAACGVMAEGSLTIDHSTLTDSGVVAEGPTLTITDSTLTDSGVVAEGPTLTIDHSTLTDSGVTAEGPTLTITDSTLTGNSSVVAESTTQTIAISGSTFTGGYSGVSVYASDTEGMLTITDSNLDNNGVVALGTLMITGSGFTGYSGVIAEGPLTITGSTFSQDSDISAVTTLGIETSNFTNIAISSGGDQTFTDSKVACSSDFSITTLNIHNHNQYFTKA